MNKAKEAVRRKVAIGLVTVLFMCSIPMEVYAAEDNELLLPVTDEETAGLINEETACDDIAILTEDMGQGEEYPVSGEDILNYDSQLSDSPDRAGTNTEKCLGTNGVGSPVPGYQFDPNITTSENILHDTPWSGSYVYYGKYEYALSSETSEVRPVKYRVLDPRTTRFSADGSTATMFLDCDTILRQEKFSTDCNTAGCNKWANSPIRTYLNGNEFYGNTNIFTALEKNTIAVSKIATHHLGSYGNSVAVPMHGPTAANFQDYTALEGDHVFLLDAEDLSNTAYGYTNDAQGKNRDKIAPGLSDYHGDYWTRSAQHVSDNRAYRAGYVCGNTEQPGTNYNLSGQLNVKQTNESCGVSPAFNVDLSKVVFSSPIPSEDNTYKLTLLDSNFVLSVTEGTVEKGYDAYTVNVRYTLTYGSGGNTPTQLSYVVTNGTWSNTGGWSADAEVLQYGKVIIDYGTIVNGTGSFSIAGTGLSGVWGVDYHVYLVAEDVNADKATDYASAPVEVRAVAVDAEDVTVTYDGGGHGIRVSVAAPQNGVSVRYGETAGSCNLIVSPTVTNANENSPKTVYYEASASGYLTMKGSATVTINKAPLTISGITARDKEYDGNTTALLDTSNAVVEGIVGEDGIGYSVTGTFADKNAGDNKTVTLSGWKLTGNGDNYVIDTEHSQKTAPASISAIQVYISGITAQNKVYDGKTTAALTGTAILKKVNGNSEVNGLTVSGITAEFTDANTGENKTVNVTGATLSDPTNYSLNIDKTNEVLDLRAGITKENVENNTYTIEKNYLYSKDNSDSFTLTGLPADCGTISWQEPTKTGSLTYTTDPSVSDNGVLSYTVGSGDKNTTGTITVIAQTQNYNDFTFNVKITLVDRIPVELKTGSSVTLKNSTLTYGQKLSDLEFNTAIFVSDEDGKEIAGTLEWKEPDLIPNAGTTAAIWVFTPADTNYAALEETVAITVNKKDVTITGVAVSDKEYDGGTAAVITKPGMLNGAVAGDDVRAVAGTAAFIDKNVGSKAVTFSGFTLGGTKAGNYNLASQPADTTAMITAKGLTVNVSAVNRAYERGNVTVGLTGGTLTGVIVGDDVSVDTASMTGKMADAVAGTGKNVTVTGLALTGGDAANYTVKQPAGLTVDISKAVWNKGKGAEITKTYLYSQAASDSVDLSSFLPTDSGSVSFGIPVTTGSLGFKTAPSITGSVMTYELNSGDGNADGSVSVTAVMQNYEDYGIKVNIRQEALALYEKVKNNYVVRTSRELAVDKSFTLVPMFVNGRVLNRRVVWESSSPDVATVTQDGKVTARSGGSTIITVRSEAEPGLTSYCMVTVNERITAVTLNRKRYTFGTGESVILNATLLPFTASQELKWSTSDTSAAVVCDESGAELNGTASGKGKIYDVSDIHEVTIKATGTGKASITALAADGSGKKAVCKLTVGKPVPEFSVAGKGGKTSLVAGKTLAMIVNWGPKSSKPANTGITWSVIKAGGGDASAIATISSKGVLTGITAGRVRVTATSTSDPARSAYVDIEVTKPGASKAPKVTGISISNKATLSGNGLYTGKSYKLKTKLTLSAKGKAASNAVAWISSDPAVATVSQKGVIKAVAPGSVTVRAVPRDTDNVETAPGDSVTFNVYAKVKSVKTDKTKLTLGTQTDTQYGKISVVTISPADATNPSIRWTANSKSVSMAAIDKDGYPSYGEFESADPVIINSGQALTVKGLNPGVVKLTGITMDGSKKKVKCTVTVRGQVTGMTLKTSKGKKGVNDVTLSDNAVTTDTIEYTSVMKANSKMTLTPVVDINGVSGAPVSKADKKLYKTYKKYTDTSVSYRVEPGKTDIATVDKKGRISIKKGTSGKTATIYVASADGKQKAEILITVIL